MMNHKAFLLVAIVLMTNSIAGADLILTLNGNDLSDYPLISSMGQILVAIEGSTEIGPNDVSVGAVGGVLEPVPDTNNEYCFEFDPNSNEATISLVTAIDMVIDGNSIPAATTIYQLWVYCNRQQNIFAAAGIGLEDLMWPEGESISEPEQQSSTSQTAESQKAPVVSAVDKAAVAPAQTDQKSLLTETPEPAKSYSTEMPVVRSSEPDVFPGPDSYPDFNGDNIVNFIDFARLAGNWKESGSGLDGDFDESGTVDADDLATFAYFWLNGPHPLDVFESFKTALATGNVNEALTCVAEVSRDKYAQIFGIIEARLPDYAAGMGEMTFDRQRAGEVIYEMLHQDGPETLSFPVFFIRDEDGNWRIFNL
ncbi:MAG TPA: hypothetical protein VJJ98_05425 [Sedimentisphaerales bacterium]|nr:hypothetical protein [Sedimentisphaerales bacterium]